MVVSFSVPEKASLWLYLLLVHNCCESSSSCSPAIVICMHYHIITYHWVTLVTGYVQLPGQEQYTCLFTNYIIGLCKLSEYLVKAYCITLNKSQCVGPKNRKLLVCTKASPSVISVLKLQILSIVDHQA